MKIWQVFSAFHQRRKQRRRRPWGRGEQAAVRRESLLKLVRLLRPDSEVTASESVISNAASSSLGDRNACTFVP